MVDGVKIRTLPFGRQEFEQDCQASSSHFHECIGSYGIENEQEVVSPFKFSKLSVSHSEELRDEIEDDVSRFKKTGEPELKDHLIKDIHWDAISGRLESQSHIATLGPAKPAESLKALLFIRWDDAAIKREPMIKIESVEDVAESVIKRERDEDLAESSMPATKRARSRRNKS
ncbi:hypothetical protein BPAE_0239g00060 [Botrytis paeoniae]|uniref:Uncharacterized protein n=1 Tax=Botrytis paeoniae TaxID=278948 RepID=A0A4Z1FCP3_9HELO|nr:hypothetical protein BPAE_0239g00060 [Botrytis paeoniae]